MDAVPDRFDSIEAAQDFLQSLSADDYRLLNEVVRMFARLVPVYGPIASERWKIANSLMRNLPDRRDNGQYGQTRTALFQTVDNLGFGSFYHAESAIRHVALAMVAAVDLEQWQAFMFPFQVVAGVPPEWRSVVVESAENLGLDVALQLPHLVSTSPPISTPESGTRSGSTGIGLATASLGVAGLGSVGVGQ